jgi:hypothetical protein
MKCFNYPMSSSLFSSFQENTKCESCFFADTCTRRVPIFMKYISTCMFIILNENSIVSFSIQYLDRIPQHNTTTVCPSDQYSRWRVFRLHTICTPDELVESREFWKIHLTIIQNEIHRNQGLNTVQQIWDY